MTSREFITWMKGFVAGSNSYQLTPQGWSTIIEELSKVSDYEDREQLEDEFFGKWDDKRIDIIGQNGNEGTHYDNETKPTLDDLQIGPNGAYFDGFDDYGQRIPPCSGHAFEDDIN